MVEFRKAIPHNEGWSFSQVQLQTQQRLLRFANILSDGHFVSVTPS